MHFSKSDNCVDVGYVILREKKPQKDNLNNLINQLGLRADVSLLGFVDNPYAYMAHSAAFVLSSAWEGFGNVIAEALAVGTPVVSTNCESGPAEILANGKYGELTPVGDAKAMAEAILSILAGNIKQVNPDWLNQFKLETCAEKYLQVLQLPVNSEQLSVMS